MKRKEYNTSEIMFVSANINYSEIYMINGEKELSCITLLKHEARFDTFIRVSKKHLINPAFVCGYKLQGRNMEIKMRNGNQVKVARRRIKTVLSSIVAV